MKIVWYLPTQQELVKGVVFGGPLKIDWRITVNGNVATVRDTRRHYNIVRVEFDADMPRPVREVVMDNMRMLAEQRLDSIRNGHEPAV